MFGIFNTTSLALYAGIALSVFGGLAYVRHEIKRADLAEEQVMVLQSQMVSLQKQHADIVKGLEDEAAAAAQRLVDSEKLREVVNDAPPTSSCVDSPAVNALLGGLRKRGKSN